MNTKIKSIEIEAFRAYGDKQVFDFTTSSGIANLVVLYAPNGFGKTSLYDAVEWGLTGKISRIENNRVIKNTAENEKGYILKNKNSSKLFGRVKISDQYGYFLEAKTKELNSRRKTDYSNGIIKNSTSAILKEISKTNISYTNILSHDKIDSFLLFSNPHERYKSLSYFWDYTKDTELYKTLYSLCKEGDNYKKMLEDEITNLNKQILELTTPQIDIKTIISQLNTSKIKLPIIDVNSTLLELEKFLSNCLNYRVQFTNELRILTDKKIAIDYLKANLSTYNDKLLEHEKNSSDYKILWELDQKQKGIPKAEKLLMEKDSQIEILRKSIDNYFTLTTKQDAYSKAATQITNLNKFNADNQLLISELAISINEKKAKQAELKLEVTKLDENLQNLEKSNVNLSDNINKYLYITNNISLLKRNIDKYTKVINLRSMDILKHQDSVNKLKNILNKATNDYSTDENIQKFYPDLSLLTYNLQKIIFEKNTELENQQKNFTEYGQLNSDLNKILKSGKILIEKTKITTCPLCNTDFGIFEKLLERVNNNLPEILKLDLISQKIADLKSDIEKSTSLFNSYIQEIKNKMYKKINYHDEIIKQLKLKNNRSTLKKHKLTTENFSWSNELNSLKAHFAMLEINNFEVDQNWINHSKDFIKELISKTIKKKNTLIESINQLDKDINIHIQKTNTIKEAITKNTFLIKTAESNSEYFIVKSLLSELNIKFDPSSFLKKYKQMQKDETELVAECIQLKKNILALKNELKDYPDDQLNIQLSKKQQKKIELKSWLDQYSQKYFDVFETELSTISIENLEDFSLLLKNQFQQKESMKTLIDKVIEYVEYIQKNKTRLEKEQRKKTKESELQIVSQEITNLNNLKVESQDLILYKVNKAFNLDIINEIYTRIDPHPDLKLVKFIPTFSDDRPELEIYGHDGGNEKLVQPVLYFSSAQIDILSLSIFLAQSLHPKRSKLDTIFMDDPISHMDSINVLSFIDLLRTITSTLNRQVILSTHSQNLYKLIQKKIDPRYYSSRFIELSSYGKIKNDLD